jgi:NADH-quinone oxidoreductase subunit F
MSRLAHGINSGNALDTDIHLLNKVAGKMMGRTICALADAAAMPVMSFIKHFRDEFEYHVHHNCCDVSVNSTSEI